MIVPLIWMVIGAALWEAGKHVYANKKFKEAFTEEKAAAEKAVRDARANLKNRL